MVNTATVHGQIVTGTINAAKARRKALNDVRKIVNARLARQAQTNPFAGAPGSTPRTQPTPPPQPQPKNKIWKTRGRKAFVKGAATVFRAIKPFL